MTTLKQCLKALSPEIVGKERELELIITAFFARGHVLIEDLPGMGKTVIAKALAKILGLKFRRIQGTSDQLASDILGVNIFNPATREFELHEGPAFAELVLFDEMNRTPPRTQSALLQVMAEKQITIDRKTYALPPPYFVIGTQNPSSSEGTFRLPDSQLDRFAIRIGIGYPETLQELKILKGEQDQIQNPLFSRDELLKLQEVSQRVKVHDRILEYVIALANETRIDSTLHHGVSVRATQDLVALSRVRAFFQDRDFVTPDDIQSLLIPCWSHRIAGRALSTSGHQEQWLEQLRDRVPLPL